MFALFRGEVASIIFNVMRICANDDASKVLLFISIVNLAHCSVQLAVARNPFAFIILVCMPRESVLIKCKICIIFPSFAIVSSSTRSKHKKQQRQQALRNYEISRAFRLLLLIFPEL